MPENQPQAIARPGVIIEIATPAGNQMLPIPVARELLNELTMALAQIDAQAEQLVDPETQGAIEQSTQDAPSQAIEDDTPPVDS